MLRSPEKVHPEQEMTPAEATPEQDSSTQEKDEEDDVQILEVVGPRSRSPEVSTSTSLASQSTSSPSKTVGKPGPRSSKMAGQQRRYLEWDELVEDLDLAIENTKTKSGIYRYNGEPLKRQMTSAGTGLRDITEQVMSSYGLEFLGIVSETLLAGEGQEITLPEILNQLENVQFQQKDSVGGEKLIIWVEDEPQLDDDGVVISKSSMFSHMLITELLRSGVEPEIVMPCHDMDEDILVCLVQQVRRRLSTEERLGYGANQIEFAKVVILQLLRIGLTITLASATAKIILIDADAYVQGEPQFQALMETADENGHTVMFFRNTVTIMDKAKEVETFAEKVRAWHTASIKLYTTDPTDFMKVEMTEDVDEVEDKRKKDAEAAKDLIEEDLGSFYERSPETGSLPGGVIPLTSTDSSQAFRFRQSGTGKGRSKQILKESNKNAIQSKTEKQQAESVVIYKLGNGPLSQAMQSEDSSESSDN